MRDIISDIRNAIKSKGFKHDIQEMSLYASHVKQERFITYLLAKALWENHKIILEAKTQYDNRHRRDMLIDDKIVVEAKFFYESDIIIMNGEKEKYNNDIKVAIKKAREKRIGNWGVLPKILDDMDGKRKEKPDIFILIILARENIKDVGKDILSRLGWGEEEVNKIKKYEEKNGDFNGKNSERILKNIFSWIDKELPFGYSSETVEAYPIIDKTKLKCKYNFYICKLK